MQTIVIDTEENDDWMKSLPGYKDEIRLHEELGKKLRAEEAAANKKVKIKRQ